MALDLSTGRLEKVGRAMAVSKAEIAALAAEVATIGVDIADTDAKLADLTEQTESLSLEITPDKPRENSPSPKQTTSEGTPTVYRTEMMQLTMSPNKLALQRTNAENSPFLRLPAELRNRIYNFVFGGIELHIFCLHTAIHPRSHYVTFPTINTLYGYPRNRMRPRPFRTRPPRHFFALLYASRQLYAETALLPFRLLPFLFGGYEWSEKWIAQKLLPAQRDAIKTIWCPFSEIYVSFDGSFSSSGHPCKTFRGFEGLEKVNLVGTPVELMLDEEVKVKVHEQLREASGKDGLKVEFGLTVGHPGV